MEGEEETSSRSLLVGEERSSRVVVRRKGSVGERTIGEGEARRRAGRTGREEGTSTEVASREIAAALEEEGRSVGEEGPSRDSEGRGWTSRKLLKLGDPGREERRATGEEGASRAREEGETTTEAEAGGEGTWDQGREIPFADRAKEVPPSEKVLRVAA